MSTSRRTFIGASAAAAAHVWIPQARQGLHLCGVGRRSRPMKAGISKWDLDTPALCVDLDKLERNIAKLQRELQREQDRGTAARQDAQVRGDCEAADGGRRDRDLHRQVERSGGAVRRGSSTAS